MMGKQQLSDDLPFRHEVILESVEASRMGTWCGGERDGDELLRRIQPDLREILGRLLHRNTSIDPQLLVREEALPQERLAAQSSTS